MLKILQARLEQYMNSTWTKNFQMFKLNLEKAEELFQSDQIVNIHWIIKKAKEFQKNIYFYFIDFDCVDHNKL